MPCPYDVTFAECKSRTVHAIISSVNPRIPYDSPSRSRRSIRLPGYDYTLAGAYFITVCAARRQCVFGELDSDGHSIKPSPIGELVIECWDAIPKHFPGVELDGSVLMPNHFHGILIIPERQKRGPESPIFTWNAENFGKPVHGSIPTIIRSFKSAVSRRDTCDDIGASRPIWHRNYYEHVIRTECELDAIRKYIYENPLKWSHDPENPATVKPSSLA